MGPRRKRANPVPGNSSPAALATGGHPKTEPIWWCLSGWDGGTYSVCSRRKHRRTRPTGLRFANTSRPPSLRGRHGNSSRTWPTAGPAVEALRGWKSSRQSSLLMPFATLRAGLCCTPIYA